ncbi:MAG: F0F1 ATP synthase subunit B [Erysipelotrichaceae bacterium]|nr:F0F1 ATP synthase subunit B [Erysipelotrichaceae bacterium]
MSFLLNHFLLIGATLFSDYPGLPSPEEFMQKIIPNLWAFLIQLLALLIMIIIFFIFAYKPVRKILNKRKDHIESQISEAEKKNELASKTQFEANNNLLESRKKADQIVTEAKEIAKTESRKIIDSTNLEVTKIKQAADEDIASKKEAAKDDIRKEIINVALDASKEIIQREVSEDDNRKLVDDFLKEMDKK